MKNFGFNFCKLLMMSVIIFFEIFGLEDNFEVELNFWKFIVKIFCFVLKFLNILLCFYMFFFFMF